MVGERYTIAKGWPPPPATFPGKCFEGDKPASWRCQSCGAAIGWLGRAFELITGCRWHACDCDFGDEVTNVYANSFDAVVAAYRRYLVDRLDVGDRVAEQRFADRCRQIIVEAEASIHSYDSQATR